MRYEKIFKKLKKVLDFYGYLWQKGLTTGVMNTNTNTRSKSMMTTTTSSATLRNLTTSFHEDALGWEAENDHIMDSMHEEIDEEEAWMKRVLEHEAYLKANGIDDSFVLIPENEAELALLYREEIEEAELREKWDAEDFYAHVRAVASKWHTLSLWEKKNEEGEISDMFKDLYGYRPCIRFFRENGLV